RKTRAWPMEAYSSSNSTRWPPVDSTPPPARVSTVMGELSSTSVPRFLPSGERSTTSQASDRLVDAPATASARESADRASVFGATREGRQRPQVLPHAASIGSPQLGQGSSAGGARFGRESSAAIGFVYRSLQSLGGRIAVAVDEVVGEL